MANVPVTVDMDLGSNCLQDPSDYSTDDLTSYYAAYRTTSLTDSFGSDFSTYQDYLDYYKKVMQIGDIGSALANMDGQHTLDAYNPDESLSPSFVTFQTEIDGGLFDGCIGSHSSKTFSLDVDGTSYQITLEDPPTSQWTITQDSPGDPNRIVIGSGGRANPLLTVLYAVLGVEILALAGAVLGSALGGLGPAAVEGTIAEMGTSEMTQIIEDKLASDPWVMQWMEKTIFGEAEAAAKKRASSVARRGVGAGGILQEWTAAYDTWNYDDRDACVMSKDVIGELDCLVVGTSIVIQADGQPMAMPLPPLGSAW
ncbi:hypothetical protein K4K56_002845 [Colletotrichum sp. SAR 10_98]|nr:hypothetical protein K4K56_002845 [Colletotrichum sp. SAR 10_98]